MTRSANAASRPVVPRLFRTRNPKHTVLSAGGKFIYISDIAYCRGNVLSRDDDIFTKRKKKGDFFFLIFTMHTKIFTRNNDTHFDNDVTHLTIDSENEPEPCRCICIVSVSAI